MNTAELQSLSTQVRRDIVRMVHAVQSGHPGGSLGCTDLLVKLYFDTMKLDASNFTMDGQGEDLFFLSNGHISPVWYSVLARRGYFPVNELATFRKLNTRLQGHPATEEGLPGIRVASGSLGQGLSVALGAAQAKLLNGEDTWVYSFTAMANCKKAKFGKPRCMLPTTSWTTSSALSIATASKLMAPPMT